MSKDDGVFIDLTYTKDRLAVDFPLGDGFKRWKQVKLMLDELSKRSVKMHGSYPPTPLNVNFKGI